MTLSATGFGPLLFLDLAAGFMLAAAASCLARTGGARAGGALALACLAGLAPPLLRDALLGMPLLALDQPACLAATLAGGLLGLPAARSCRSGRFFFWQTPLVWPWLPAWPPPKALPWAWKPQAL